MSAPTKECGNNHNKIKILENIISDIEENQKLQKLAMDQMYETLNLQFHLISTKGDLQCKKGELITQIISIL